MVFTRLEKIVLISSSIIFGCFFLYLFYKVGKIVVAKIRVSLRATAASGADGDGGRRASSAARSASERRVQRLLNRPGVRNILAARVNTQIGRGYGGTTNGGTGTAASTISKATSPPPNYDDLSSVYSLGKLLQYIIHRKTFR